MRFFDRPWNREWWDGDSYFIPGPGWAGGRIFDAFNSYMWLYVGASTVALGAVAVAFAFSARPQPQLRPA